MTKWIHDIFNDPRLRKTLLKLRLPLGVLAFVLVLMTIKPSLYWWGVGISAFGLFAQLWCFACIKTQKRLAEQGPYMLVRNPMYLARYFLFLGCLVWTGNPWVIGIYTILYYFYMYNRVLREEALLKEIFGEAYEAYLRDVNRFLPSINKRCRLKTVFFFDPECFRRNHGASTLVIVLALYALAYYVTFVYPAPFK